MDMVLLHKCQKVEVCSVSGRTVYDLSDLWRRTCFGAWLQSVLDILWRSAGGCGEKLRARHRLRQDSYCLCEWLPVRSYSICARRLFIVLRPSHWTLLIRSCWPGNEDPILLLCFQTNVRNMKDWVVKWMTKPCLMVVVEGWVFVVEVLCRRDAGSYDGRKSMLFIGAFWVCLLSFQISLNIPLFLWSV
jgi:hypothetical protein